MTSSTHAATWTTPHPGEIVAGKYKIEGECGRGGLATVLAARHLGLGHRVALKLLLPALEGNREAISRFLREGRAAAAIQSEHAVRVHDVGLLENGAPYLVLEYLEGQDLERAIDTAGPLSVEVAVDWILQVCEAIAEAHAHGVIHRDLKPSNLFLTSDSDGVPAIKVIDFGLSKVPESVAVHGKRWTRPSVVMGSPHYMAPEQLKGLATTDARVDIWALGAVLYEFLVGEPPFRRDSLPELFAAILTQPAPLVSQARRDVPEGLTRAIARCLEREPAARFSTVADFARAIAPFGTPMARISTARILRSSAPEDLGERSSIKPHAISVRPSDVFTDTNRTEPDRDRDLDRRRFANPASMRTVLTSLVLLSAVGTIAFAGLYASVHPGANANGLASWVRSEANAIRTMGTTDRTQDAGTDSATPATTAASQLSAVAIGADPGVDAGR